MFVYLHGSLTKNRDCYFHVTENKCDGLGFTTISRKQQTQTRKNLMQKVGCYPGPNQIFILLFYETVSKGNEKHRVAPQAAPSLCLGASHCPGRESLLRQEILGLGVFPRVV